MASSTLTVQEMVDHELSRNPQARIEDLHWMGTRIDPDVAHLSLEDFEARFVKGDESGASATKVVVDPASPDTGSARRGKAVDPGAAGQGAEQVSSSTRKRRPRTSRSRPRRRTPAARKPDEARAAPTRPGASEDRARHVRGVLFDFARELVQAETRGEIIRTMASVDDVVERVLGPGA
jgi:hypothetical protein